MITLSVLKELSTTYFDPRKHGQAIDEVVRNLDVVIQLLREGWKSFVEYPLRRPPYAVILAGSPTIMSTLISFIIAESMNDKIEYIITSHEVVEGKGVFKQSHDFLEELKKFYNFETVVVDFTKPIEGLDASKLLNVLKNHRGRVVILQGAGFVVDFLVLNAGCTRLVRPYPTGEKLVFYDLTKMVIA